MVKLKARGVVFVMLVILLNILLIDSADARGDWGYLTESIIKYKINEKFTLKFYPYFKFTNDSSDLTFWYFRGGVDYRIFKPLTLGIAYQDERLVLANGRRIPAESLLFDITFAGKFGNLCKLSNRHRFQIKNFDNDEAELRYRPQLGIDMPIEVFGIKLTPFISNEFGYSCRRRLALYNWFDVGIAKKMHKNLIVKFFYRLDSSKSAGKWSERHIIGNRFIILF
ncbi:DUF2490 domain-containing protein [bacterium]|nr:DUF2490 domain-containing protein [bacterium]